MSPKKYESKKDCLFSSISFKTEIFLPNFVLLSNKNVILSLPRQFYAIMSCIKLYQITQEKN